MTCVPIRCQSARRLAQSPDLRHPRLTSSRRSVAGDESMTPATPSARPASGWPPSTCARRGFAILERNYRTRWGELDLIAYDGRTLAFCEVKARRRGGGAGGPFDAVDRGKRAQVRRIAGRLAARAPRPPAGRGAALRRDRGDLRRRRAPGRPRAPGGRLLSSGERRFWREPISPGRAAGRPSTGRRAGAAARRRGARSHGGAPGSSSRRAWRTPSPGGSCRRGA